MGIDWGQLASGFAGGVVKQMDARDKEAADIRAEDRAANRQLAMQERLEAAREMMTMRAEERKRKGAASDGLAIETKADGMLNASRAEHINKTLGSSMTAEDAKALEGNEQAQAIYGLPKETELTKLNRRADAASGLGMLTSADQYRKQGLDVRNYEDKKADNVRNDKRLDADAAWRKTQADLAGRREDRQARVSEATLAHQKTAAANANTRVDQSDAKEMRSATAKALDSAQKDVKALEIQLATAYDPAAKEAIQDQMKSARQEVAGYRRALSGAGLAIPEAPPGAPAPPPKTGRPPLDSFIRR